MIPPKKTFFARFDKWIVLGIVAMILAFMFNGCGQGLDKELKKKAKAVPDTIKTTQNQIDTFEKQFADLAKSPEFASIASYTRSENLNQKFAQAAEELTRAKELYDKDLNPLVKKNKPELAPQVMQQIERIEKVISDARDMGRYPLTRFSDIQNTIQSADDLNLRCKEDSQGIFKIVETLQAGAVAKALADFPDSSDKINARFAPLASLGQESQEHLKTVEAEFAHHQSGSQTDYAAFTDSSKAILAGLVLAKELETTLNRELGQLYTSYTKILKDMKADLFVTIKRESWDERSDYYDPRFATFQRQVTPDVYEALTTNSKETIADISSGFTGSKFSSHIGNAWQALKINPTEQWPARHHNAASFWVEDTNERYFHKYILEEKGQTTETDWEQVDESLYEANLEFLGMAILAKPYGVFEKDRIIEPTPPGMAYVGDPKYGEWQKDSSGNSFWSWYGRYAFFSMLFNSRPYYYGYNSWNGWNNNYRNRRPYYGSTAGGSQKYGTSGSFVKNSSSFQRSSFAKSGGFKSQTASVRGAGANLRGGGPKSKGK